MMKKNTTTSFVAGALALMASAVMVTPAFSGTDEQNDLAYQAIQQGQWQAAENQLRAELAANPGDPMRLLNLAYVLQNTGRNDEAKQVYQLVLQMDSNPLVAVGSDNNVKGVTAKSIARKGVAALD